MWFQKSVTLKAKPRGFHLVSDEILQALLEISSINVGLLHLFLQHTSASLSINVVPTVRCGATWNHISINSRREMLPTMSTPMRVPTTCQLISSQLCLAVR
jgi:hypothetical protein